MNNAAATLLLANKLRALASHSLDNLVAMIDRNEVKTVIRKSGMNYQIELNVFLDSKPGETCASSTTAAGALFCRTPMFDHETRWALI